MHNKLTNCTSCGAEIATSAKTCPQCGAKIKRPITKKWWFWVLIVIVAAGIIGGASSGSGNGGDAKQPSGTEQPISYTHYNDVVDSDGKYIGVGAAPNDYNYILQNVQCYIKDDTQKQQIMEIGTESPITVRGKIISVGEVLGFSMNIDSIN